MSEKLINLSPDLKRLRDSGADLQVKDGYVAVHDIPYVGMDGAIKFGSLISDLQQNGDKAQKPKDHQVWFTGEYPCYAKGKPIEGIRHSATQKTLFDAVVSQHRFSNKPKEGYADYYDKMSRYMEIVSNPARSIKPEVTPYPFKPIRASEDESVFVYTDSASSRHGITALSRKCAMAKVVILGLGGTGSYVLDLVAKTPIKEIHLIDGDKFEQHNAFRAPGAASMEALEKMPFKVNYFANTYSAMRRGIHAHPVFISDDNITLLQDADFVFMCVDKPAVRKLVFDYLIEKKIPFIDTGMELEYIEETESLIGDCRATLCTPEKSGHICRRVSTAGSVSDDLYASNIQLAELNSLNANLAVVKWKKYCGFYQDHYKEYHTIYSINTHQLGRDELLDDQ